jgi:hypothetical protein
MQRAAGTTAAALLALALGRPAQADPFPSLDLHGLRPPMAEAAGLRSESPAPLGNSQLLSTLSACYALRPVAIESATTGDHDLIAHQLVVSPLLALGLGTHWTVAADLPIAAYQAGDAPPAGSGLQRIPHAALGDLQLRLKATLLGAEQRGGFQWALTVNGTAPTGHGRSTLSDHAVSGGVTSLMELDLLLLRLRGGVGVRVRSEPRNVLGDRFEHQVPWVLGIVWRPQVWGLDDSGRWLVHLEGFGSTTTGRSAFDRDTTPVGVGLSTRLLLGDLSPLFGVELPLNEALGNPRLRAVVALSWTPHSYDSDHDSIGDERDECPEIAEDKDGYEDGDGCIDHDNDDDGVIDSKDACPYEKEDEDGFADQDGCADSDNDRDGLVDRIDACPGEPGPHLAANTEPGCPIADRDRDHVLDDVDACPRKKEDHDGFQDTDGCPEADNDNDGIADRQDRCPNKPGPRSAAQRGCPVTLVAPPGSNPISPPILAPAPTPAPTPTTAPLGPAAAP